MKTLLSTATIIFFITTGLSFSHTVKSCDQNQVVVFWNGSCQTDNVNRTKSSKSKTTRDNDNDGNDNDGNDNDGNDNDGNDNDDGYNGRKDHGKGDHSVGNGKGHKNH
jgi:hypothetical protein